jgi:hypothetical protein
MQILNSHGHLCPTEMVWGVEALCKPISRLSEMCAVICDVACIRLFFACSESNYEADNAEWVVN